jgi:hypothetical protein
MEPFHEYIPEYQKQLKRGTVKAAYQGLMQYFEALRLHFKKNYPDYFLSDLTRGNMDYTYFYFFPKSLKTRQLKIVVFFSHADFRFEVWLAGYNKTVQAKYWKIFKAADWSKYPVASTIKGVDYIVAHVLVENPDFKDLDALTKQIESGTLKFISDVEAFLEKHPC